MRDRVERLLGKACASRLFSGAAWSFGTAEGELDRGALGTLRWDTDAVVDEDSWWDLASLTKPIVGLVAMSLIESGQLTLDDRVATYLPDFAESDKADLTVRDLLTHTSGIPGQVPLYRWCRTPGEMTAAIRDLPLAFSPGERVVYSSQGFIVLGMVLEAAGHRGLAELVADLVTRPTGMTRTGFALSHDQRQRAVATEDCPWRGRVVQGEVHDENAVVLARPAGHAGLFAPLTDVALLALTLSRIGGKGRSEEGGLLAPATMRVMTAPATDHLQLRRALAWQGHDPVESPAGDLAGSLTYGHTGFTGTSLYVDPDTTAYVVLLTNRVHPTRAEQGFARLRRAVHNTVFAQIGR